MERENEEEFFRTYLADSFYYYTHEQAFNSSYSDLLKNANTKQDNRTAEEIVQDVFKSCGLSFKES